MIFQTRILALWLSLALSMPAVVAAQNTGRVLSLAHAVAIAQQQDPWLQGSRLREASLAAQSDAAAVFPDPQLSLGALNLPTDTFDLNREPMTQVRVGVAQRLPPGDSLALSRERLAILGGAQSPRREERRARVASDVASLWLDAWLARESGKLVAETGEWFRYLHSLVERQYASGVVGTIQGDIVRTELELGRLLDRQTELVSEFERASARLREWLGAAAPEPATGEQWLAATLPEWQHAVPLPLHADGSPDRERLGEILRSHPAVRAIEREIEAAEVGEQLAREANRPQWALNASYGYREDPPVAGERADFFSLGVSVELPLFSGQRQRSQVSAARADTAAMRTDRTLALRRLRGELEAALSQWQRLVERETLYRERLLPQADDQVESALNAYTSDTGDFAEVVRAKIAGLDLKLEALRLAAERVRLAARLDYFFAGRAPDTAAEGRS